MTCKKILIASLFWFIAVPLITHAESPVLIQDTEVFEKAKVIEVKEEQETLAGGTLQSPSQILTVEILSGSNTGKVVTFNNDYTQLSVGDIFFVRHQSNDFDQTEYWSVADPYRLDIIFWLAVVFVLLLFLFGGIQGVRGLASLVGSLFLIFYLLIPGIYGGYNAVLVSIGVSSLIIIVGSYITHGVNRTTTSAVLGMIITVVITGLAAYYIVYAARLSGYSSEESMYLNLSTKGSIDMVGLLFGGIIIGLLGVLYDIAIGQAVAIEELFRAGKSLTRREVYKRGIRIGREHIGALVNTLAIAYVGASLPLILLMKNATTGALYIINSEVISTEIIRILVGSTGLILAVPITTLLTSYMLYGKTIDSQKEHHHHH